MFTVPITYENPDGQMVTKDYYFNITKAEMALTQLESDGDWAERINRIKNSNQGSVVIPEFKKIIEWTYGERRGDSFVKTKEVWDLFEHSEAWSNLIMMFFEDATFAAKFVTGVLPPDMRSAAQEEMAKPGFRPGADTVRPTPTYPSGSSTPDSSSVAVPTTPSAEPVQQTEASPVLAPATDPSPTTPVEDVQRQSEPRSDLFGQ